MKPATAVLTGIASACGGFVGGYLLVRPHLHRWGATEAEVHGTLPGDDIIVQPALNVTFATTIDAPIDAVWPWIVQLGQGRGGWYSYDWLENVLGLNIHTAERILHEFQHLAPGDVVPTGAIDIPVIAVEPPRLLLLGGAAFSTLAFVLQPLDEQRTRLLFRNRAALGWTPSGIFWRLVLDPGIFIMSRKMLLVIKERAEGGSQPISRSKGPPYNRFVLRFAGRKGSPFAIIEHRGRQSGRVYRTPVDVLPTEEGAVIALGHGPTSDWCRNIMAAGTCTMLYNGGRHAMRDPQVIDLETAAPLVSPFRRWLYTCTGANDFLRLRHAPPVQDMRNGVPETERAAVPYDVFVQPRTLLPKGG